MLFVFSSWLISLLFDFKNFRAGVGLIHLWTVFRFSRFFFRLPFFCAFFIRDCSLQVDVVTLTFLLSFRHADRFRDLAADLLANLFEAAPLQA